MLLQISNLRVTLPVSGGRADALRDVSLTVDKGQTLGLIGESGSGKSLTALAVMGLLPESAGLTGSIQLDGQELVDLPDPAMCRIRGARVAMIFQEPMTALNPLQPVGRQISEPLRLHEGLSAGEARKMALHLLDRVRLPRASERLDAYPHQLSGGQRQRVMIAMALACRPELLIADEPTTALDVTIQKDVLDLVGQLVREDGMGLLLISHDLALMRDRVDRVAVMYAGSIVEEASTEDLFARRAHPYTRGLFAARPRLDMARGSRLATIEGRAPSLGEFPAGCAFADRCSLALDACRSGDVPWQPVSAKPPASDAHRVRCPRWAD